MDTKAGSLFHCVCCKEDHNEHEASFDEELRGPVCDDCRKNLRGAVAWLQESVPTLEERLAGFKVRPFTEHDLNSHNFKRFKT